MWSIGCQLRDRSNQKTRAKILSIHFSRTFTHRSITKKNLFLCLKKLQLYDSHVKNTFDFFLFHLWVATKNWHSNYTSWSLLNGRLYLLKNRQRVIHLNCSTNVWKFQRWPLAQRACYLHRLFPIRRAGAYRCTLCTDSVLLCVSRTERLVSIQTFLLGAIWCPVEVMTGPLPRAPPLPELCPLQWRGPATVRWVHPYRLLITSR